MSVIKSRFVAYTEEEEDAARRLGTAAALLWSQLPEIAQTMLLQQALMIEPASPAKKKLRADIESFIAEKSAEGSI